MEKEPNKSNGSRLEARALDRALGELRRLLASGRYPVGSRLPAERDFALTLRVGRSTLRKALAVLEADGKIWRHVGQGTFVGRTPPGEALPPIAGAHGASPREVLDARLVLEPAIAQFAAVSARPDDIAYLRKCLTKREAAADPETYEFWDHTLHRAIAEATHNPLLVAFLEIVNRLRREPGWKDYRLSTLSPERRTRSSVQHRAIVDAIEARNAREAFEAMRAHIDTIQTNLFREQEDAAAVDGAN